MLSVMKKGLGKTPPHSPGFPAKASGSRDLNIPSLRSGPERSLWDTLKISKAVELSNAGDIMLDGDFSERSNMAKMGSEASSGGMSPLNSLSQLSISLRRLTKKISTNFKKLKIF